MTFARRFVQRYLESGASQYGGMLAYNLFVSLVPLALGVVSVFGLIARNPRRFATVRQMVIEVFPPDAQGPMRDALLTAGQHAWTIIALSLLGLVWFGTGLFSTTGFALNQIYGWRSRTFWHQRLRGLMFPLELLAATALAVTLDLFVRLLHLPALVGLVGIWIALTILILLLYRRAPSRSQRLAEVLPGALLAGAAIVLFGFALTVTTNLTFHLGSDTRFFAQVFGLVAWVYFIAQAILLGAVVNRYIVEVRQPSTVSPNLDAHVIGATSAPLK